MNAEVADRGASQDSNQSAAIFEYLEGFYNRARRHSTLDYLSPVEFEQRAAQSTRGVH